MKQIVQNIRSGRLSIVQTPPPAFYGEHILIANAASLISAGTEKMVMDLAQKSLLGKARERPDHVRRVIEKVRQEGLVSTVRAVLTKLDAPMAMGYASAGVVLEVGEGVQGFKVGDRVASNGPHAGVVSVAKHLCARVPDSVPLEHAAFTVLGAIAMQGVRLSRAVVGETVFVIGLGLVGQLTVAILKAAGCRVIGTDLDAGKCELAVQMGAAVSRPGVSAGDVEAMTGGLGADAVVITASTKSNGPIDLAAGAVRPKGRVVLVGVVGLELDRRPFYFKEAEFVVSCSYGPGRYDPSYEEGGHDYPAAHVRWTEQRNMQAVLELMATGSLDVAPLISHRFPIERAESAYEMIEKGTVPYVGIVLEYPQEPVTPASRSLRLRAQPARGEIGIAVLGAGNFARTTLLPAIVKCKELRHVALCTASGMNAQHDGRKFGFEIATTDEDAAIGDASVKAAFIITRHNLHARQVLKAINAGKHVFVEKPLCLTREQLDEIETTLASMGDRAPLVMVGFNRRFSPSAILAKQVFVNVAAPLTVSVRFNAGLIPPDHWTQDPLVGGGRLIGEACHAIDLATFLTGSPPVRVFAECIGGPHAPCITQDQCFITLRHANGSVSNIAYLAGGDKAFPKERVEVIGGGRIAVIDDFRVVTTVAGGRSKRKKDWQDKGHTSEVRAFVDALAYGTPAPIAWEQLRAVTLASIAAVESLQTGLPVDLH